VVTCEPADHLPPELRRGLAAHWRIDDTLDAGQIAGAVQAIGERLGPVNRLLAVLEQLQVPVAQVREQLGIAGIDVATARNFRDKAQMKSVLRAAGGSRSRSSGATTPRASSSAPRAPAVSRTTGASTTCWPSTASTCQRSSCSRSARLGATGGL
jgi:hypothetical protein